LRKTFLLHIKSMDVFINYTYTRILLYVQNIRFYFHIEHLLLYVVASIVFK
jgi:hypothetical protein